jgi:pyruvate-ferredoxin/flavodoxin oxidoreductase
MANETRFGILKNVDPARASELAVLAQAQVHKHYAIYQQLAQPAGTNGKTSTPPATAPAAPAKS